MAQTRKCINQNCDHKFSIDTRRVLFLPLTPAFGPFNPLLSIAMNDLSGPKALNWTRRRKTWDYLAAYFCLLFYFFSFFHFFFFSFGPQAFLYPHMRGLLLLLLLQLRQLLLQLRTFLARESFVVAAAGVAQVAVVAFCILQLAVWVS